MSNDTQRYFSTQFFDASTDAFYPFCLYIFVLIVGLVFFKSTQPTNGQLHILRSDLRNCFTVSIPKAAIRRTRSTIVRVTQLPNFDYQEDLKKWLCNELSLLSEDEQTSFTGPIHVVPSCNNGTLLSAIVDFEGDLPLLLRDIRTCRAVYHRIGSNQIRFDSTFHGFTQLYATTGTILVDIIAVTGLGGHAFGSWRGKESGAMWLKDFLAEDLPNCRTMIYGYDSKLGNPSDDTIVSFGQSFMAQLEGVRSTQEEKKRPIIFLAHSFGGIIITHCLTEQSKHYLELRKVTRGVVFFGTPHRGFDVTDLKALILSDLITGDNLEGHPQERLLAAIETYADAVIDRLRHFVNVVQEQPHPMRIISCYELYPTQQVEQDVRTNRWYRTGPKKLMVDKAVALLGLGDHVEMPIPIQKDHSDMTKFDSRSTYPYTDIVPELKKLVTNACDMGGPAIAQGIALAIDETERRSILKWILGDNDRFHEARDRVTRQRFKGNCAWFLKDDMYRKWIDGDPSAIWLTGKPGSGKTVLCSTLIDALSDDNEAFPHVYYFFDRRNVQATSQKFITALRTIIYQLCTIGIGLQHALVNAYRICGNGLTAPSHSIVHSIFNATVRLYPKLVVVLDALDECTDHGELVSWLGDLCRGGLKFHLLVSSRDTVNLSSPFSESRIRMEDRTRRTIGKYINRQIAQATWSEALKDEVCHTLSVKADGLFYWVDLALNILKECPSEYRVHEALLEVPSELYAIYEHILENLKCEYRDHVLKILQWLAFAMEDLSPAQVSEVVAIDYNATNGDYFCRDKQWSPKSVVPLCGGLVSITSRMRYTSGSREEVVKLSHFSIKEFMHLRQHIPMEEALSHYEISKACLGYILQFEATPVKKLDNFKAFNLAFYAARHWLEHACKFDGEGIDERWGSLVKNLFLDSAEAFQASLRLSDPDYTSFFSKQPTQLYYTTLILGQAPCHLVGADIIKLLILRGADVNARGGQYGSPLGASVFSATQEIVELLIEKGADVNAQGDYCGTPLGAAAYWGRREIVELLIKRGADVNALGGRYGSPLGAAAHSGTQEIVELLIEKGANVNAQGGHYGSPLGAAVHAGTQEIVELLIEKGADVNARGCYYGSPLGIAACLGTREIVELLIERGADVNARGGHYGRPLGAAAGAQRINVEIAKLLIEKGADVNAKPGKYESIIEIAVKNRQLEIIKLLFERGARVALYGKVVGSLTRDQKVKKRPVRQHKDLMIRRTGRQVNEKQTKSGELKALLRSLTARRLRGDM